MSTIPAYVFQPMNIKQHQEVTKPSGVLACQRIPTKQCLQGKVYPVMLGLVGKFIFRCKFKQMDTKKAIGHDNIATKAIKEKILVIAHILVFLINRIIRSSCLPDCLKFARVKLAFKRGDKFAKNNYRPI